MDIEKEGDAEQTSAQGMFKKMGSVVSGLFASTSSKEKKNVGRKSKESNRMANNPTTMLPVINEVAADNRAGQNPIQNNTTDPFERENAIRASLGLAPMLGDQELKNMIETTHERGNEAARQAKTIHLPLMDMADADDIQSQIDYRAEDIQGDTEEEKKAFLVDHINEERAREAKVRKYAVLYPKASIKSKNPTHMDRLISMKRDVYGKEKPAAYGIGSSIRKVSLSMQANAAHNKKRISAINNAKDRLTDLEEERDAQIAAGVRDAEVRAIEMLLVLGTKSESLSNMRKLIAENGWIIPNNASAMSISEICKSVSYVTKYGHGDVIVPGTIKVEALKGACALLGFDDFELFRRDIESGVYQKNITDIAKILKGDLQGDEIKGGLGLDALLEEEEAIAARDEILENEDEDYVDVSEDDYEDEMEENMESEDREYLQDMLGSIAKNQKARFLMPMRYSNRFTYKVVYFIALNRAKTQLAFGKTLPERPFNYMCGIVYDPHNDYGLRHDKDSFMLKIGGIGLLEKSAFFADTHKAVFRRCYKAPSGNASDLTSMKNITVAVYTSLVRLSAKREVYMELNDFYVDLKDRIDGDGDLFERIYSSNDLSNNLVFVGMHNRVSDSIRRAKMAADSKDALSLMLSQTLGIRYDPKAATVDDALQFMSFGAVHMAGAMVSYAEKHANKIVEGTNWFIMGMIRMENERADYFTLIFELIKQESVAVSILNFLFPTETGLKMVKKALKRAGAILEKSDSVEIANMLASSRSSPISVHLAWADTVAGRVQAENQQVHALVKSALEEEAEAEFAAQDKTMEELTVENVNEMMYSVSVDGVFSQRRLDITSALNAPPRKRNWKHKDFLDPVNIPDITFEAIYHSCSKLGGSRMILDGRLINKGRLPIKLAQKRALLFKILDLGSRNLIARSTEDMCRETLEGNDAQNLDSIDRIAGLLFTSIAESNFNRDNFKGFCILLLSIICINL